MEWRGKRRRQKLSLVLLAPPLASLPRAGRNKSARLDDRRCASGCQANRVEGDSGGAIMSENWHKRQAICMACQLPENASDANAIIRELQNLVDTWLHPAEVSAPPKVVSIVRDPA